MLAPSLFSLLICVQVNGVTLIKGKQMRAVQWRLSRTGSLVFGKGVVPVGSSQVSDLLCPDQTPFLFVDCN